MSQQRVSERVRETADRVYKNIGNLQIIRACLQMLSLALQVRRNSTEGETRKTGRVRGQMPHNAHILPPLGAKKIPVGASVLPSTWSTI